MIKGAIFDNRPLIRVTVGSPLGVQDLIALVDTGFSGELKLSPKEEQELGLIITHAERITLANGQTDFVKASIARVALENVANTVNVIIGPGDPLVGMGLLQRFGYNNLNFDFGNSVLTLEHL